MYTQIASAFFFPSGSLLAPGLVPLVREWYAMVRDVVREASYQYHDRFRDALLNRL